MSGGHHVLQVTGLSSRLGTPRRQAPVGLPRLQGETCTPAWLRQILGSPEPRVGADRLVGAAAWPCPYPALYNSRDIPSLGGTGDVPWAGAGQDCSYPIPSVGLSHRLLLTLAPHMVLLLCSPLPQAPAEAPGRVQPPPPPSLRLLPQQLRGKNSPEQAQPPQHRSAAAEHRHRGTRWGRGFVWSPAWPCREAAQAGRCPGRSYVTAAGQGREQRAHVCTCTWVLVELGTCSPWPWVHHPPGPGSTIPWPRVQHPPALAPLPWGRCPAQPAGGWGDSRVWGQRELLAQV